MGPRCDLFEAGEVTYLTAVLVNTVVWDCEEIRGILPLGVPWVVGFWHVLSCQEQLPHLHGDAARAFFVQVCW